MKDLPTTTEIIEPEEVRQDPASWKLIGEEIAEELHFEPSWPPPEKVVHVE